MQVPALGTTSMAPWVRVHVRAAMAFGSHNICFDTVLWPMGSDEWSHSVEMMHGLVL
jgi:hypothetical protein